ncbi:MAG: DUF4012 domain-containing protein [Patescibacteria group bacterium]
MIEVEIGFSDLGYPSYNIDMRKIEDIRPGKRRAKPEVVEESGEVTFTAEDFLAESASLPVAEPDIPEPPVPRVRSSAKRIIGQLIFLILAFTLISIFCFIATTEAKKKISKNFLSLSNSFLSFSENISSKDIPKLAANINEMDSKISDSLILLQSTGQDLYALDLLYPKKQASKATMSVDMIRSAHLLTGSYKQIANPKENNLAFASDSGYLAHINNYLAKSKSYFNNLPNGILYAKVASGWSKVITDSIDASKFSGSELTAVNNMVKLSNLSGGFFNYYSDLSRDLQSELGFSGKKSYLILFLNNTELRFGGGFIGSFARLDLENGKATALDFETNIYKLDQAYSSRGDKELNPPEFEGSTKSMRESNYYPDFAESSQSVIDIYQKESGNRVDGVFALDTTFFRELLKVTGPIEMPEYNLTINEKNFLSDVQYQVEIAYFQNQENKKENQPKKILADMMPKLVEKLMAGSQTEKGLAGIISAAIREKHLLFYFRNNKVEELVSAVNAGGTIKNVTGDYVYVANANIGGAKSSLNVAETIDQEIAINSVGKVEEKLVISRKHNGSYNWPDSLNRNFVKVHLPLSTQINSIVCSDAGSDGPGADKTAKIKNGKSVVAYWQSTAPGEKSSTEIKYLREIKISPSDETFTYPLTIQKQPGVESFNWNLKLAYPEGWKPENVEGYDSVNRVIYLSETIRNDATFTLRFIRD